MPEFKIICARNRLIIPSKVGTRAFKFQTSTNLAWILCRPGSLLIARLSRCVYWRSSLLLESAPDTSQHFDCLVFWFEKWPEDTNWCQKSDQCFHLQTLKPAYNAEQNALKSPGVGFWVWGTKDLEEIWISCVDHDHLPYIVLTSVPNFEISQVLWGLPCLTYGDEHNINNQGPVINLCPEEDPSKVD